jgi:hypothetical protein
MISHNRTQSFMRPAANVLSPQQKANGRDNIKSIFTFQIK